MAKNTKGPKERLKSFLAIVFRYFKKGDAHSRIDTGENQAFKIVKKTANKTLAFNYATRNPAFTLRLLQSRKTRANFTADNYAELIKNLHIDGNVVDIERQFDIVKAIITGKLTNPKIRISCETKLKALLGEMLIESDEKLTPDYLAKLNAIIPFYQLAMLNQSLAASFAKRDNLLNVLTREQTSQVKLYGAPAIGSDISEQEWLQIKGYLKILTTENGRLLTEQQSDFALEYFAKHKGATKLRRNIDQNGKRRNGAAKDKLDIPHSVLKVETDSGYKFVALFPKQNLLGEGGFGRVKLVQDIQSGEYFALKIEKLKFRENFITKYKFMLEEYKLGKQQGLHLGKASKFTAQKKYQLMRLVPADSMFRYAHAIKEQAAPSLAEQIKVLYVMINTCAAVSDMHKKGIIHRDIKLENILCSSSGAVKIIDYGLAKKLRGNEQAVYDPLMWGSNDYLAPEFKKQYVIEYNQYTDRYALGVTLKKLVSANQSLGLYDSVRNTIAALCNEDNPEKRLKPDLVQQVLYCVLLDKMLLPGSTDIRALDVYNKIRLEILDIYAKKNPLFKDRLDSFIVENAYKAITNKFETKNDKVNPEINPVASNKKKSNKP